MFNDGTKNYIGPAAGHIHRMEPTPPGGNSSNGTSNSTDPLGGITGLVAALVFFYTFVALTGLISNVFILTAVIRRMVIRNTVNIFLASLAFSDFLMILLSLFDCFSFMDGGWNYGVALCKIQSYFVEVTFTASTLTLVAVSCERYLLICHPHMKRRTINSIYRILCGVWVLALLFCAPLLHGYIVYEDVDLATNTSENVCAARGWSFKHLRVFYGVYSGLTYLIPLLIMGFAHWQISMSVKDNGRRSSTAQNTLQSDKNSVCFTIREESSGGSTDNTTDSIESKNSSSGKANCVHKALLSQINSLKRRSKQNHTGDYNRREKRLKAIKLLFVVTVMFFVLWTPFILMRLLLLSGVGMPDIVYKFSEILIFSSTAINGFIYAFMSPPFRKAFKALLCCTVKRELVSRDSGPSISNSEDNRLMNHRMNSRGSSVSYHVELSVHKPVNHHSPMAGV